MVQVMENKPKINVRTGSPSVRAPVSAMVEDIVGCKWSLSVVRLVRDGIKRPGAMQKAVDGLSTKVLNERLRKLQRFGIIDKRSFAEVPPRVEYRLTEFGQRFSAMLDRVDELQTWLDKRSGKTRE